MKRILVTAGGTAMAWHITEIAKQFFQDVAEVQVCDCNEPWLVPASQNAAKTHRVPLAADPAFVETLCGILRDEKVDILIPLLPMESALFSCDSERTRSLGIRSSAAPAGTSRCLSDKATLYRVLRSLDIPTPAVYAQDEVSPDKSYVLKPRDGFGSQDIDYVRGGALLSGAKPLNPDVFVIQEDCRGPQYREATVEVYNGRLGLRIFARERVSTKAGVCVKMVPLDPGPFLPSVEKLIAAHPCPLAFNMQFLYHEDQWKLYDCNLRLGAGTALSTAAGFQLTRAFLAELLELPVSEDFFAVDRQVRSVLRVYREVVIR